MAEVVVVGAGPAGLAAALFGARRGHLVTVVERDPPPPNGSADDDVARWARPGVPHAPQGHVFLARSTEVLRAEAPDVLQTVLDRGAVEVAVPGGSSGNVLARRLVYEAVLRRAVDREPRVVVRSRDSVVGLLATRRRGRPPRVVGIRTKGGEDFAADVVVDATGRTSQVRRWLAAVGAQGPAERSQACGFFYVTRHYRLRAGASFPTTRLPVVAPLDYVTALAFPGDNRTFQLSLALADQDPQRHRVHDARTFDRLVAAVPLTAQWSERAEPMEEPRAMAGIRNRWRTLCGEQGPVVGGLVLLGDAAIETNPTAGRGVALAFVHARGLASALDAGVDDPYAFVDDFERWTAAQVGALFRTQLAIDRARLAQLRAGVAARRLPPPADPVNRLVAAMSILRDTDETVETAAAQLYNLLVTPSELMADRSVIRPLLAYLRAHEVLTVPPAEGPDRATFERIVAG